MKLFDRIVHPGLLVRRMYVAANHVVSEEQARGDQPEQMDFFTDYAQRAREDAALDREKQRQRAVVEIRRRFGKNALLRGMNFEEGATARERNGQIGGHRAEE